MKILLCTNSFSHITNGPAKFAHLILEVNKKYPEHEVHILTEDVAGEGPYIHKLELKLPTFLRYAGQFIRMTQYYKQAVRIRKNEFQFDILIYNHALLGLWSALFFRNTVGFINDYNNLSASFGNAAMKFRFKKFHVFKITEWLACRLEDKIIVNSEFLKQEIIRVYNVSADRVFRLYKSIELEPELKKEFKIISHPKILFVKNDYRRAGLFVLLDALKMSLIPCELVIIGTPLNIREEIESICYDSNVHAIIMGAQSQETVYQYMRMSDIFCVPAFKEALGVSNIEAMALGCSVISTTAGGIPEVLDHGNCGWMVEPGDAKALADAILECMENPVLRERKYLNGLKQLEKFKLDTMLSDFISILEN